MYLLGIFPDNKVLRCNASNVWSVLTVQQFTRVLYLTHHLINIFSLMSFSSRQMNN
ncbi:hypothetical protein XF_0606 [Xylella fastidiosa 9a5c]|uniref:Uncharacterized protein n=1 Tax=Xylella fastidiosa (strain 9a5c) TaxID=160492 RepID=Q9PFQ1_XYLFA|nr:hypothetical protein XF_0606 [Xylella fastidiosa 9a5c]